MLNSIAIWVALASAGSAAASNDGAPMQAAPVPTVAEMPEPNPKRMTQAEIRDHNAKLTPDHPYYIDCRRSTATGSLVRRNLSCRTNQQWTASDDAGNREARTVVEGMASKAWPTL